MELSIAGEDMSSYVTRAIYEEYAAARCDALQLELYDESAEIRKMGLKKGDVVSAEETGLSTGVMYISEIGYVGNTVSIRALSLKTECFSEKSFYKEKISFLEIVKEIEKETGCTLELKNQMTCFYVDITRIKQNPIAYLTGRLKLEGYQLKIYNNTLIVYDERIQEAKDAVEDYTESDFIITPEYSTKDANLIESIQNIYKGRDGFLIKTNVESGISGKHIEMSMAVSSIAESERFSRGVMREINKYEFTTYAGVDGLLRKAGQSVNIACDISDFSGKNYIYAVKNNLIDRTQRLYMRKIITGGY